MILFLLRQNQKRKTQKAQNNPDIPKNKPNSKGFYTILANDTYKGTRLDILLSIKNNRWSRSVSTRMIRDKMVLVNGQSKKPGYHVKTGDRITVIMPDIVHEEPIYSMPEPIEIDILYEDEHIIIVNKPAGLVVHPGPGHQRGTLVHGLTYRYPELLQMNDKLRPGIVHRLDKDTSGALVVAKNDQVLEDLKYQFKNRTVRKSYLAIVHGHIKPDSGTIDIPLGRDPFQRKMMSSRGNKLKHAKTSWRVKKYLSDATYIELDIKTGRTHQIRVHCASIGHPVIGDPLYGGKNVKNRISSNLKNLVHRQMLHSWRLIFMHSVTKKFMEFKAPLPDDMEKILQLFS